ncbi:UPF0193 protein EVG1 [Myxocyprinus asiaticus]|uniref:UPF0193 protein EVG1 n=1 Tax=Myxocyprinus asiaticus TaxID=70543 RepID=UPI00222155E7|nr:UPF0193 protein EVG1 [Myxocyprinus asiaticus]
MMQESRLMDFHQRQIKNQLKKGGALPLNFNLTPMEPCVQSEPRVTRMTALMGHPQRRNSQGCRAGDNYKREQFRPSATRDLEKEKRKLQNLLATGQEEDGPTHSQRDSTEKKEQQTDRFQEVLDEIEDRRQFLEEMMATGKGHQYQHIINTEISQKICELEKIDRNRGEELRTLMMNGKEGRQSRQRY